LHKATQKANKIHTLHEVVDHLSGSNRYEKILNFLFKERIRLIVHSKTTFNRIVQFEKCDSSLVTIIPFGLFETYRLFDDNLKLVEDSPNIILYYGFIRPYKGLNVLTDAIKILNDKFDNYRVVIAGLGDIPQKAELENDRKYIILNRYLSNNEIVALNKQAKIVVCPYFSGSQSGIVMTTFLFDKPIIASNIETFTEIITDGQNGLLINPNSPEELARSILKLLGDDDLYNHLCRNIRMFGQSGNYAWKGIADLTYNTYFHLKDAKNPYFTLFTSVFNGENHIHRVLESVDKQIFRDFEWIIVNDGSVDGTSKIIRTFIDNHPEIDIIYLEQENSGKHIAWNRAVKLARGKLFIPSDADDYFLPDTLSFFNKKWEALNYEEQSELSGISVLCLDNDTDNIVGTPFPFDGMKTKIHELYFRYRIKGEKWGCTRMDLLKNRFFPELKGKYFPEDYLWLSFSKTHKVLCFNKALRRYYTTSSGLSQHGIKNSNSKHADIQIKYNLWFIANHGFYMLIHAPGILFRSLGSVVFQSVMRIFRLIQF
jgi:glycosyltransferase involved in cell wall biosynthesis